MVSITRKTRVLVGPWARRTSRGSVVVMQALTTGRNRETRLH